MEITASIYNKANLFFLQKYGGAEAVAQYSAAWQVVDGFSCLVAGLVLQNVLYPVFVRLWKQDRPAVIPLAQNTASWLLVLALPLMFLLVGGERPPHPPHLRPQLYPGHLAATVSGGNDNHRLLA